MDTKAKELAQQVMQTQEGITPEQLKALLDPGTATTQPTPTQQPAVEPAPAPAPSAPAEPAAPAAPAQGEPVDLSLIPEKFRSKDVPTSLKNITKSYSELEDELRKQKDEVSNMQKLVQSFIDREPSYAPPAGAPPVAPPADVDDAAFFEKPTESVKKIAAQMANAQIVAYHIAQQRQAFVEGFKQQHPDFEGYRPDIMEILRARPDLDRDEKNLPLVYELAKQRYQQRIATLRKDIGIAGPQPTTPTTPQDADAIRAAAYEQAKNEIIAELTQRRAASGLQGSSPATSPNDRVQPRVKEQPLSDEDKIIQDMLNSGPKVLKLGE
jgi:cell division septum initiation protein DivIVA